MKKVQSHRKLIYTVYTFIQLFTENLFRKIALNRITQNWNSAILHEMKFKRMVVQSALFSHKNVAQQKQKYAISFAKIAQKFCKWTP